MNRKTYGAHCSGWQHSLDERRHMVENLMLLAVVTVTVCGFLVLAFQPYAGPWSILAGFCCCTLHDHTRVRLPAWRSEKFNPFASCVETSKTRVSDVSAPA